MTSLLILAVAFLAVANGANDNFKGVAGLYSGVAGYRSALAWGCATTLAGSLCSAALAAKLLSAFTGAGLVRRRSRRHRSSPRQSPSAGPPPWRWRLGAGCRSQLRTP
jgi:hypothetical protein